VGGGGEAPPALRARVLPGSEQFDPQLYLGNIHAETALPDLVRGLAALRSQLSEHTGQLKALVKENFDRFISSKNTIDTVYAKLQKAEVEGEAGVHGASTGEVMESVLQVQGEAQRTFGPLLDRQAKADRIRLVLGVMQRYEALLALPSRVRQHAEAGDYEQVVADYRKARALLADQAMPASTAAIAGAGPQQAQQQPDGGMWAKLMHEIDKVVSSVAHSLDAAVRSMQSSPTEAYDAIRHLLELRAVGVPAAAQMEPIRWVRNFGRQAVFSGDSTWFCS
jgi:exocyst complex component 2